MTQNVGGKSGPLIVKQKLILNMPVTSTTVDCYLINEKQFVISTVEHSRV